MENASKALIIAGAILLAILIISLGIMIYRNASGVVDSNSMDEVSVASFNEKFEQYCGANVRGSNVNALISTINQNNRTYSDDTSKQVEIVVASSANWNGAERTNKPSGGSIVTLKSKAQTGKSYKVEATTDENSGYITKITISDAGTSSSTPEIQ